MGRRERYQLGAVLLLLVVLHFAVRLVLGDRRGSPDLVLVALLLYAIQARPGPAAAGGFLVGLMGDALNPVAFGAGALAHTVVGYLAAWGKAIFFAERLTVIAVFFLVGCWLRDLLVLLGGRHAEGTVLLWELILWSPLKAATTALAGVVSLVLFQRWLHIRVSAE